MNRRMTLTALAVGSASLMLGARAAASYPDRPVRVVSPYTAGGNTDFITRLITQHLQEELQQTFVVENRPGAGGASAAIWWQSPRRMATRCWPVRCPRTP